MNIISNISTTVLLFLQRTITELETRLQLKEAETVDLRQKLARNGTVVSDVNGKVHFSLATKSFLSCWQWTVLVWCRKKLCKYGLLPQSTDVISLESVCLRELFDFKMYESLSSNGKNRKLYIAMIGVSIVLEIKDFKFLELNINLF